DELTILLVNVSLHKLLEVLKDVLIDDRALVKSFAEVAVERVPRTTNCFSDGTPKRIEIFVEGLGVAGANVAPRHSFARGKVACFLVRSFELSAVTNFLIALAVSCALTLAKLFVQIRTHFKSPVGLLQQLE